MNKQTEALKLALEALEVATTPLAKDRQEVLRAQAAIREALAEQPAQQQEPYCYHDGRNIVGKEYADHSDVFPLYTSPPASKPWVGLTDEQIDRAIAELGLNYFADAANNRAVLRELCRKAAHGIKE